MNAEMASTPTPGRETTAECVKRPYRSPELVELGDVAELTQASPGGVYVDDGTTYQS